MVRSPTNGSYCSSTTTSLRSAAGLLKKHTAGYDRDGNYLCLHYHLHHHHHHPPPVMGACSQHAARYAAAAM